MTIQNEHSGSTMTVTSSNSGAERDVIGFSNNLFRRPQTTFGPSSVNAGGFWTSLKTYSSLHPNATQTVPVQFASSTMWDRFRSYFPFYNTKKQVDRKV